MDFDQPFLKLPVRFDAEALEREVRALPDSAWVPHPTGFKGNEAVRLVTVGGEPTDGSRAQTRPTGRGPQQRGRVSKRTGATLRHSGNPERGGPVSAAGKGQQPHRR